MLSQKDQKRPEQLEPISTMSGISANFGCSMYYSSSQDFYRSENDTQTSLLVEKPARHGFNANGEWVRSDPYR